QWHAADGLEVQLRSARAESLDTAAREPTHAVPVLAARRRGEQPELDRRAAAVDRQDVHGGVSPRSTPSRAPRACPRDDRGCTEDGAPGPRGTRRSSPAFAAAPR